MVIDFKEIPKANSSDGFQDTFELFSRDFLEDLGFEILHHPDRGADGKKDLIISEVRIGVGGKTILRWLVSCKHYAHSGKSVSDVDEPDIIDRVTSHKCQGFFGIYSTLAATSLGSKLNGYRDKIEHQVYDRERIEKHLLDHPQGIKLARRYFPVSMEKFVNEHPKPAKIFREEPQLNCEYCGKNILKTKNGILIFATLKEDTPKTSREFGSKPSEVKHIYFCCKGDCDTRLEAQYRKRGYCDSGWEDIDDLMIPTIFLQHIMAFINNIKDGKFSQEAIDHMKNMYMNIFPHIARHLTNEELERVTLLYQHGLL